MPAADSASSTPVSATQVSAPSDELRRSTDMKERRRGEKSRFHPYGRPTTDDQPSSSEEAASAASMGALPRHESFSASPGWRFPGQADARQSSFRHEQVMAQCLACGVFVMPTPLVIQNHERLPAANGELTCANGKNGQLSCGHDGCTMTFPNLYVRTSHLKNYHGIEEKTCVVCGKHVVPRNKKQFQSYPYALGEHILEEHFNVKNWKCAICKGSFRNSRILSAHASKSHLVERDPFKDRYINASTGLPRNARYVVVDPETEKIEIVVYPINEEPPGSNPVNWFTLDPTS